MKDSRFCSKFVLSFILFFTGIISTQGAIYLSYGPLPLPKINRHTYSFSLNILHCEVSGYIVFFKLRVPILLDEATERALTSDFTDDEDVLLLKTLNDMVSKAFRNHALSRGFVLRKEKRGICRGYLVVAELTSA